MLIYLCWISLLLSSGFLIYQDFKSRLISTWLIVLFTVSNIYLYISVHSAAQLFNNFIFCLVYFLLCYIILHVYFYLKTRRLQKLLDDRIGWGDVFLCMAVGSFISPENMIYFFTATFVLTVFVHFLFFKQKTNVPLAGYLLTMYLMYLVFENFSGNFNL